MFNQFRMEQPEDRGYEDWIKETGSTTDNVAISKHLQGGFTKNRFNDAFEKEGENYQELQITEYKTPQERFASHSLNVHELGVDTIRNFTGKTGNIQYTDYREAHTNTRCIQPNQNKQVIQNRAGSINELKQQRNVIKDYNENEWNDYNQEQSLKLQTQENRLKSQEKQDMMSSKHYDSIHTRMLENVWK